MVTWTTAQLSTIRQCPPEEYDRIQRLTDAQYRAETLAASATGHDRYREMHAAGYNDYEIARAFGASAAAVCGWRQRRGLPARGAPVHYSDAQIRKWRDEFPGGDYPVRRYAREIGPDPASMRRLLTGDDHGHPARLEAGGQLWKNAAPAGVPYWVKVEA